MVIIAFVLLCAHPFPFLKVPQHGAFQLGPGAWRRCCGKIRAIPAISVDGSDASESENDIVRPSFPRLAGFFHPLVKVVEKRSAGPGVPCGVTRSCRALSALPGAAQAAVTPDANHTYPISGFARL